MTGNRNASDPGRFATAVMAGFALVGGLSYEAWVFYHAEISRVVVDLKLLEFRGMATLFPNADPYCDALRRMHPATVTAHGMWLMLTQTGMFYRPATSTLLLACAFACALRAASVRFGRRVDMTVLQRLVAQVHPIGAAWVGYRLPPRTLNPGERVRPLDPPLKPREWTARFCVRDGAFSPDDASAALTRQCGAPWTTLEDASPVVQCLAMAFILHHRLKTGEARKLLETLSLSVPHPRADRLHGPRKPFTPSRAFSRKMAAMAKDASSKWPEIKALVPRHHYTTGVLLTLLQTARKEGSLLNPGLFSAVQFYDRSLWMVLQGVSFPPDKGPIWGGAGTSDVEALGALEHWEAECIAGAAIARPMQTRTREALQNLFSRQARENTDGPL